MFSYDSLKEASRKAEGKDHCASTGPVFDLASLIVDGLIHDPSSMANLLTAGVSAGKDKRALIYAVGENFEIRVAIDGVRGTHNAVKHETLFHNADVLAAGELEVEAGMIVKVGDVSGTYGTAGRIQTDPVFVRMILFALEQINAPIEMTERRLLAGRAGTR